MDLDVYRNWNNTNESVMGDINDDIRHINYRLNYLIKKIKKNNLKYNIEITKWDMCSGSDNETEFLKFTIDNNE